MTQGINTF